VYSFPPGVHRASSSSMSFGRFWMAFVIALPLVNHNLTSVCLLSTSHVNLLVRIFENTVKHVNSTAYSLVAVWLLGVTFFIHNFNGTLLLKMLLHSPINICSDAFRFLLYIQHLVQLLCYFSCPVL
jgi:hypothetical protein